MATASAQPIALPSTSQTEDYQMNIGSLTGQNGSFTPASFRRFMGSPISFRAGSFGSRFYPGVSPGQFLGQIDPNDYRLGKMSSSIESDRGSLLNVMNVFDRQEELCRDYQCCGVNLTDMHALVDHFEECHVVVVDPYNPQGSLRNLPSAVNAPSVSYFQDGQQAAAAYTQGSFDPDDMELDMENTSAPSSGSSSPPDTPITTPLTAYPSAHLQSHLLNAPSTSSGLSRQPISAFDTTTVMPSRAGSLTVGFPPRGPVSAMAPRAEEAFNTYSGYSEFSSMLPGTVNGASMQTTTDDSYNSPYGRGVPPALLLNSSAATSPSGTPDSSRVASPVSGAPVNSHHPIQPALSGSSQQASSSSSAAQTARASTTLSRPASSLLLSKPFKCPKPNCNKSYKQANGLKYHMTHGSCNFAPPKDLEQLQALLASRQKGKDGGEGGELSESEMREVEREAERRLRPYACGVGECQRRYKNMNGLRYHYQHSGDHGAIGLALLASGQHECLQHTRSHSRHVTPAASQRSSPLASQAQASSSSLSSSHLNHSSSSHSSSHLNQNQQSQSSPTYNSQLPSYQSAAMHPPTYTLQPQQVTPSSSQGGGVQGQGQGQGQGQQNEQQNGQQQQASAVPMQMQYMMQMQGQR